MIKYLIRQERKGGYFLLRKEGRAIEVSDAGYRLLARLHHTQGRPAPTERAQLEGDVSASGGEGLLELLLSQGLDRPENWASVRHVPSDVSLDQLPDDAAAAPKRIYFEITRGCNLSCQSCFNNSHHRLENELTLDEILEVNRQAGELGVFEIRYTGGECTTVTRFADVVADARNRGIFISIGTNGVYTDEQLNWVPYCGVDWFIISVDGDEPTHDKVRGGGTFQRVVRTVAVLAELPSVRVRLNMTVGRHNVSMIEAVARVAAEYGVASLNMIPLRPYGRAAKTMTPYLFDGEGYYEYIREVRRLRALYPNVEFIAAMDLEDPQSSTSRDLIVQKKQTCAAGVEGCVIGPQGHMFGCSYSPASFPNQATEDERGMFIAGNIRSESMRTIWRDSSRWQVFRNLHKSKNEKCFSCNHYGVRCTGSCQIMSYYEKKHQREVSEGKAELKDFQDPYCPKEAFELQHTPFEQGFCGKDGVE